MTFFKFLTLGVVATFFAGCTCSQQTNQLIAQKPGIVMGGVPAWLAKGPKIHSEPEPVKPDPCIIDFESESGPVEFAVPLERSFKPHCKPFRSLKKKEKCACDPVPVAIEREMDRCRNERIKRLVR